MNGSRVAHALLLRAQSPTGQVSEIAFRNAPGVEEVAIRSAKDLEIFSGNALGIQGLKEVRLEVDPRGDGITLRAGRHFITVTPNGIIASAPIATDAVTEREACIGERIRGIPLHRLVEVLQSSVAASISCTVIRT